MDKTESITPQNSIIIYHTDDGKSSVVLYANDGQVWMNQKQMAELFATSPQNIGQHITNILNDNELQQNSVIKNYFTTASDGKRYEVTFYSLDISPPQKWKSRWRTYMPILTNAAGLSMPSKPTGKMSLNFVP